MTSYNSHAIFHRPGSQAWLATVLLALSLNLQANTVMLDGVIAIVDSDVVLASELEDRLTQIRVNLQKEKQQPTEEQLRREVLDLLILENIQLQMGQRAGVRISDAQLNEAMIRIASQNKLNLEQFRAALESDGLSYLAIREQVRKDLILQRVQQGNVNQRIQITEQEVSGFLSSEEGRVVTAPQYRLLHGLVPVASEADAAAEANALALAQKLKAQIEAGEQFQQVITSQKINNVQGGDLGWRKPSQLPSLFSDIVPTLKKLQVAEPIRSASGYHLIQLADSRGDSELIKQTRARHILVKASAIRSEQQTEEFITDMRQKILNGMNFEEMARDHSEDIGSAREGGDLGWTSHGQLVPEFQKIMDETKIEAISPAFKSRYGWHIVKVIERREKDMTEEAHQNQARNFIHQRKFQEELQAWLQKIRDEAYVDIK